MMLFVLNTSLVFLTVGDTISKATFMRLVGRGYANLALSLRRFHRISIQLLAPHPHYTDFTAAGPPLLSPFPA